MSRRITIILTEAAVLAASVLAALYLSRHEVNFAVFRMLAFLCAGALFPAIAWMGKGRPRDGRMAGVALFVSALFALGAVAALCKGMFTQQRAHTALLFFVVFFSLNTAAAGLTVFLRSEASARVKRIRAGVIAVITVNSLFLWFFSEDIQPAVDTLALLGFITGGGAYCMCAGNGEKLQKYRTGSGITAVILISLYSSLASFAYRFFFTGDTRMHFSLTGAVFCLSGMLWFIPVICLILTGIGALSDTERPRLPRAGRISRAGAFWIFFGVLAVCQIVIFYSFWPCGFPSDCIDQLRQAYGESRLDNAHPVLHTLIIRLLITVFGSPGAVILTQMLLLALLCAAFLALGYDHGLKLGWLCAGGAAFILLPNQVLSEVCAEKDFPYALALLWGTYLLVRCAEKHAEGRQMSWADAALIGVDAFLIYGLRHNGVVPFIFIILLLVWMTVRRFKFVRLRALAAALLAVVCVGVYKGPVFDALDVAPNKVSNCTTMLCAVGSCVNKDLPLSDEANEILEKVMPLESWGKYYARFSGHDRYVWWQEDGTIADFTLISTKEAFQVYFEALSKYPDVIIKDRLDGMNLMWDVTQPDESFNFRSLDYVENMSGIEKSFDMEKLTADSATTYRHHSVISDLYREAFTIKTDNPFDILLWRTGAYIIALLCLILFWCKNRIRSLFWGFIPIAGNIAGLILVLYHQSFRYVYAIQLSTAALIFSTAVLAGTLKSGGEKQDEPSKKHEKKREVLA